MNARDHSDSGWPSEGIDYGGGGLHNRLVAHIATNARARVANTDTASRRDLRYAILMWAQWVSEAIEHAGIRQAALARALTEKLGRSIDRAAVNKMTVSKRAVSADEALAISEITGYALPVEEASGTIEVPEVTWVKAGDLGPRDIPRERDVKGKIVTSDLPPGNWIALRVRGTSMNRIAPDGSRILVNRSNLDLADGAYVVVVSDEDGGTTFKRYYEDPPRLEPCSNETENRTIYLRNELKVVGRVYRVIFDLSENAPPRRRRGE